MLRRLERIPISSTQNERKIATTEYACSLYEDNTKKGQQKATAATTFPCYCHIVQLFLLQPSPITTRPSNYDTIRVANPPPPLIDRNQTPDPIS